MSKIEDKLEHFTNDIMADVGDERRQIIEAVDKELKDRLDKAEMDFLSNAYELIQEALIAIDQEKNEQYSKTVMENKVRLLRKRNDHIEGMFEAAKEKLRAFAKSEAYLPHVLGLIDEAKALLGEGELEVHLNASDAAIKETVEKKSGLAVTLESKKVDLIGGCKVFNVTSNMIVDFSFLRKLEDQREDFIFKCHLNVE